MEKTYFFDSWGGLWVTCSFDDPKAKAFGPSGIAREATSEEAGLQQKDGETQHAAARRLGLLERADLGFDLLKGRRV